MEPFLFFAFVSAEWAPPDSTKSRGKGSPPPKKKNVVGWPLLGRTQTEVEAKRTDSLLKALCREYIPQAWLPYASIDIAQPGHVKDSASSDFMSMRERASSMRPAKKKRETKKETYRWSF